MKHLFYFLLLSIFLACSGRVHEKTEQNQLQYPHIKKVDTTDNYFGTKISDPYRWLEDDNSAETAEWVKSENKVTFDYLSKIPYREKIKQRLTKVWNFTKYGTPFKQGDFTFLFKNDGVQNQSVLYVQKGEKDELHVLIDPNTLSKEGTTALRSPAPSKSGKILAYMLSEAGSDWNTIHLLNVENATGTQKGKEYSDELKWVKFSGISWKGDEGFYYSRYDEPKGGHNYSKKNEFHKVYFHKVGDTQEK